MDTVTMNTAITIITMDTATTVTMDIAITMITVDTVTTITMDTVITMINMDTVTMNTAITTTTVNTVTADTAITMTTMDIITMNTAITTITMDTVTTDTAITMITMGTITTVTTDTATTTVTTDIIVTTVTMDTVITTDTVTTMKTTDIAMETTITIITMAPPAPPLAANSLSGLSDPCPPSHVPGSSPVWTTPMTYFPLLGSAPGKHRQEMEGSPLHTPSSRLLVTSPHPHAFNSRWGGGSLLPLSPGCFTVLYQGYFTLSSQLQIVPLLKVFTSTPFKRATYSLPGPGWIHPAAIGEKFAPSGT
ncbi:uncharacterized protein LOC143688569 [Tamandua tetradactyla]|uniref:uncharacterized protein LOC143688569 n=1 Tax=Tamandua tetradactyla TaxID=48850 RepID=UPI004053912C